MNLPWQQYEKYVKNKAGFYRRSQGECTSENGALVCLCENDETKGFVWVIFICCFF